MHVVRGIARGVLVLAVAGCASGPRPPDGSTAGPSAGPPDGSIGPIPTGVIVGQLAGPWRRSPIVLDDPHVAIISDACAAAARQALGETEANLPTALIDARGEGLATAILADDLTAIECLVTLDAGGTVATVESVDRLAQAAVAPVDAARISVASVVQLNDRSGGRTVAFGRIGPAAEAAKVGLDDASVVVGSSAAGWWAMWWQGSGRATSYSAVDGHDITIGSAPPPLGQVEARVGPAAWWLDPTALSPTPATTLIHAVILEASCASGTSPDGRLEPPMIEPTDASITVTFSIRRRPGGQDCQGNPPFRVEITLPEPLGTRTLLDGSATPPRDATKVPAG